MKPTILVGSIKASLKFKNFYFERTTGFEIFDFHVYTRIVVAIEFELRIQNPQVVVVSFSKFSRLLKQYFNYLTFQISNTKNSNFTTFKVSKD